MNQKSQGNRPACDSSSSDLKRYFQHTKAKQECTRQKP